MFHFLAVFFRFGKEILFQIYYFQVYVLPNLKQQLQQSDSTFSAQYLKRMRYYGYFVPAISGANYAILLNRKLTKIERIAMTQLAAAAPIFDDYFDAETLEIDTLSAMIASPETFHARTTLEKVLVQLLLSIKVEIPDFPFFMKVCNHVFEAQLASKQQKNGNLSPAEIRKITYDKGGYSTLLFKSVMAHASITGEDEAIYHFGGLVQLVDDIFDMYEDAKDNIQTLATTETQIPHLTQTFTQDLTHLCQIFQQLDLQPKAVRKFLDLQLFFFTRTFVCLQQFESLQPQNASFNPKSFERKALICDMEKWVNIKSWIRYFLQWRKQLG